MVIGFFAVALFFAGAGSVHGQASRAPAEFKGWTVRVLEVRGLEPEMAAALKSGLALSERRAIHKTRRAAFYPAVLNQDVERARLFLARRGYPDARIETAIELLDQRQSIRLVLSVTPGRRVTIGDIGPEGLPAEIDHTFSITPAMPFSDAAVEKAVRGLEATLKSEGYARASVETRLHWIDSTRVSVTFSVDPGIAYRFNEVRVTGVPEDLAGLVRRSSGVKRGRPYSPATVDRVRMNLRTLDLFRQVRVSTVEAGGNLLDVHADLIERRPRTIEAGLGYWTDDLLRGRLRWEHRNLFGGGRGLRLGTTASKFLQTARASTWWPALLGARTRATLSLSGDRQDEDSFELLRLGGGVGLSYFFSLITSARVGLDVSWVDVERKTGDPGAFVEEGGLLSVLSMRLSRNSTNDRLYPSKGTVFWVNAELAPPGAVTETHFALVEASGARYRRLFDDVILAGRVNAGIARPIGGSVDLLPNKRFFAGGATSMRGFRRRHLGPVDDAGLPIGGELKLTGTIEVRFPLVWRFGSAVFVDAGQVWRRAEDARADDVEVAIGPGLMIRTPVGPIRADWGYRLTDFQDDDRSAFHIAIGHPF